jgi:DNA-binding MarR family transcriptional regulator
VVNVTHPHDAPDHDLRLAEPLVEALGSVRRQMRRTAGRPMPSPLSGSQIELVRLVRRQPGIAVNEAAGALGLAGNTVSTLVRQLAEAGVLRRESDPADRRVARLHVTGAARRRIEGWRDHRTELTAQALGRLSADDARILAVAVPALNRLAGALHDLEER